jgi:glycosyltransferase involved in cell wall biosynthesis
VKEKISSEIDTHGCVKIIRSRTVNSSITEIMSMTISIDTSVFLKKILKNFEVVHAHEYRTYENIVLHHYARKYDIPYVLQAHGSLLRDMPKKRLKYVYDIFFGYRLLRDAFKVIALSSMEAEQYKRMGVPEEKIAIIPNGIDLSEYAELPPKGSFKKKFNIPEDKKIILYLGRIHKIKGIDFLVKAYAYLVNEMRCRDAILVIAGPDDGYLDDAKALANSLGIYNSVMFTGFISEEDKLKAFVDAEVFVTPSFYGFPLTFLEACAVGTPIVTTSLGDELEWIDNNVGYVSRPTPTDLAEAIYRIVFNEELHRRFSKNCIEIVNSKFSIEKVVEKLEKVYAEIVKG